jgi:hypothetical protein
MENENLKQRIDVLEKRLATLERADNIDSLKYWREKMIGREYGANDVAVTETVAVSVDIGTGLGTLDVLGFPDGYIDIIKPNGDRVRVPYYSLSRF